MWRIIALKVVKKGELFHIYSIYSKYSTFSLLVLEVNVFFYDKTSII